MRAVIWHLCGRFYAVRARRARLRAMQLQALSEDFFRRIGGGDD